MDVDPSTPSPDKKRKLNVQHKDVSSSPSDKKKNKKRKLDIEQAAAITTTTSETKKKRRQHAEEKKESSTTTKEEPQKAAGSNSPFKLTTATFYVPLSPISISLTHALSSLIAEHLSPLLLVYHPPLKGVVLAYSNAWISENPPTSAKLSSSRGHQNPAPEQQLTTRGKTANEYGVLYVYLTATFLLFRPERHQTLEGFVNVQSEDFLHVIVYNLFSVVIERKRLPSDWKWIPPGQQGEGRGRRESTRRRRRGGDTEENESSPSSSSDDSSSQSMDGFDPEREHFFPSSISPQIDDDGALMDEGQELSLDVNTSAGAGDHDDSSSVGYFESVSGHRVRGTVRFRVVDIDVIPGVERDSSSISIEGTMLSHGEEAKVVNGEKDVV